MSNGRVGRLSKQKSVMNIEANPLETGNLQTTAMKVESLSDCTPISAGELSNLISRLTALEANEERLKVLEEAKLPHLFSSEQLLKILEITTSLKTKIQMIGQVGPRLIDPKAKTQQFLDLFRFSDEKNQVEEILKARSQAIVNSQFSTASTAGRGGGGGGRGGILGGRGGGGRGGAGRGAGLGAAAGPAVTRPMPSVPASNEQTTEVVPEPPVIGTPAKKHLEVNTTDAATTPINHPFSPGSTVSTPGNEPVVSDIHDVFSFLDSAVSPSSARPASRRITMDTISEREVDEDDSEEDEDEDNGKSSQHALADDTSLTTTETAPSVSTMTSSPYVRSQLPTTGSMVHNLSDGSLTETDSKAADAAVALIAAIVAKEGVVSTPDRATVPSSKEMDSPKPSVPVEPMPAVAVSVTTNSEVSPTVVEDQGPEGGLLLRPVSRSNSIQLDDDADGLKSAGSLDLSARPRSFSNPNGANVVLNTSSGDGYSNAPRDRNSLLKQSLHHSSFTAGHVQSKDEELQAVANATSQIRQMAAKIFSGGDKESAIAVVTGPTAPVRALQRTHSEVISKELSRSTGSIQYQPAGMKSAASVSKATGGAGDDLVIRYASQAKLSKEAFLSLSAAEPIGQDANGEDVYSYHELLRRNFWKDYGVLKQTELQRYLADAEFTTVFGKTKQEFDAQAKWRQVDQKKKALLF